MNEKQQKIMVRVVTVLIFGLFIYATVLHFQNTEKKINAVIQNNMSFTENQIVKIDKNKNTIFVKTAEPVSKEQFQQYKKQTVRVEDQYYSYNLFEMQMIPLKKQMERAEKELKKAFGKPYDVIYEKYWTHDGEYLHNATIDNDTSSKTLNKEKEF